MNAQEPISKQRILELLDYVKDPEIPAINVLELGVVRNVVVEDSGKAIITITPTYTGCPAMDVMAADIKKELLEAGVPEVEVKMTLSPAWTTDWMTQRGRDRLREYGIVPPAPKASRRALFGLEEAIACPRCGGTATEKLSEFGSTACKSLWRCADCREPFDHFKCL